MLLDNLVSTFFIIESRYLFEILSVGDFFLSFFSDPSLFFAFAFAFGSSLSSLIFINLFLSFSPAAAAAAAAISFFYSSSPSSASPLIPLHIHYFSPYYPILLKSFNYLKFHLIPKKWPGEAFTDLISVTVDMTKMAYGALEVRKIYQQNETLLSLEDDRLGKLI